MININDKLEGLNDEYFKVKQEVMQEKSLLDAKLSNAYEKRKKLCKFNS